MFKNLKLKQNRNQIRPIQIDTRNSFLNSNNFTLHDENTCNFNQINLSLDSFESNSKKKKKLKKSSVFIYENLNKLNLSKLNPLFEKFKQSSNKFNLNINEPIDNKHNIEKNSLNISISNNLNNDWDSLESEYQCEKKTLNTSINLKNLTFYPQSWIYICWLVFVTLAFFYNCWFILIRSIFMINTNNLKIYFYLDCLADLIYLFDVLWFKPRLKFIQDGLWINDLNKTKKKYFSTFEFKIDCLSILPIDLINLITFKYPFLRLNKLLKIRNFWELFERIDFEVKNPYIFRIIKTLIYLMFLVHLNTCAYYYISYLTEFDANNNWNYDNKGNAYLRCFYFGLSTAVSISNRVPTNSRERLFMIVFWISGLFTFAFLIGQIKDIIATATQNETCYRNIFDQTVNYMESLEIPFETRNKVREWLHFTWKQQNTFDECSILNILPTKNQVDIALNEHLKILKKVKLFQCLERNVICDFILKLKPVIFLPQDWIFKKDEIGTDMFIISYGKVQVCSDREGKDVLAILCEGSYFGEISVLNLDNFSKYRTASIRSLGYSKLFKLTKNDLWETLKNYKEAQEIIKKKATQLISEKIQKKK